MKAQLVLAMCGMLTLAAAPGVFGGTVREETTTEKTTTYRGTISEFAPGSSTLTLDTGSGEPMHYTVNEKTTFVDANGNVVSRETIRNQPVTVYTAPEGGSTIVSKVVVSRPGETTTRKETTTEERH